MANTNPETGYYARVKAGAPEFMVHMVGLLGTASVVEGVRQMYAPAAWIVGGVFAMAWTVMKVRAQ